MTKVKLGGNFNEVPDAKPAKSGLYTGEIVSVEQKNSKNDEDMVEIRWNLVGDENGKKLPKKDQPDPVWSWHPTDPESSWARRMKELLRALGVKLTGSIDIKEGSKALLQIKEGTDDSGNARANVAKIIKLGSNGAEAAEDEDEEEDDEAGATVDLDEMDRDQMKVLAKEYGVRVLKKDDDDALRAKIQAAMPEDDEEEEDEEEDDEEEEDAVDLDTLNRAELKAFKNENAPDVKILKSDSDDDIRGKIAEAMGAESEDDEEEDDEEEGGDNYDELDFKTLSSEAKDRDIEIPTKGTAAKKKATLIARLRKDDAEEPV